MTDLVVYQLEVGGQSGGSPQGLFQTVAGAKAEAQRLLDTYWAAYDGATEEENESYEVMTTRTLEWADEERYIDERRKWAPLGPAPTARFGEHSKFTITKKAVKP